MRIVGICHSCFSPKLGYSDCIKLLEVEDLRRSKSARINSVLYPELWFCSLLSNPIGKQKYDGNPGDFWHRKQETPLYKSI